MMKTLEALREEIEIIDGTIIEHLAVRKMLSEKIGQLKMEMGKAVFDAEREKHLLEQHRRLSLEYELDPVFVEKLFEMILLYSRDLQKL